jgi:hypothetical protein
MRDGRIQVLSDGAGLNSWAMLLDAVQRGELPDYVVHVDTGYPGDPGEWPSTALHIVENIAPLCEMYGIPFLVLTGDDYPVRGARSLFAWLQGKRAPGEPKGGKQIPVAGPKRRCTTVAKVERFERWLDDAFPGEEVEVWIGFERGEEKRAAGGDPYSGKEGPEGTATRINRYPLIERGLCRCRCERLARRMGWPVPRKSACTYCPYGSKGDWQTFARELPKDFAKVVKLEKDKPPTEAGIKLSIMGFKTPTVSDAQEVAIRAIDADPKAEVNTQTLRVLLDGPGGLKPGTWPGPLVRFKGKRLYLTQRGNDIMYALDRAAEFNRTVKPGGNKQSVPIGGYKAPPLPQYIKGKYTRSKKACKICGAKPRATKATGIDFLTPAEFVEDEHEYVVLDLDTEREVSALMPLDAARDVIAFLKEDDPDGDYAVWDTTIDAPPQK